MIGRKLDWDIPRSSLLVVGGLTVAQLLAAVGQVTLAIMAGIIGADLAPDSSLATLPITVKIVGVATAAYPVSRLIRRFGRRRVFMASLLWASGGALLASWSIAQNSFIGFCIACYLMGNNMATVAQYRFVAASNVPSSMVSRALAFVMLGMLGAAFLAPWVSLEFRDLFAAPFSGSFAVMPALFLIALLIIAFLPMKDPYGSGTEKTITTPLKSVLSRTDIQLAIIAVACGNGVMSLIMTATPVSMHVGDGHTVEQTADVIRSHILGMFVPSLFSGWLIAKLGLRTMLSVGLALEACCVLIAINGQELWQYRMALVSLGIGWNLLFLGGTTLLTTACPTENAIRVQGVNETVMFSTMAVCSLSAGILLANFGWVATNLFAVILLATLTVAIMRNFGSPANRSKVKPVPQTTAKQPMSEEAAG